MMNYKNIIITTSLSILFGMYSIYNIIEYLNFLQSHHNKEIRKIHKSLDDTRQKYKDLNEKYIYLQKHYEHLSVNYDKISKELVILNLKISEFKNGDETDNHSTIISEHSSVICDDICELNNKARINMETMRAGHDDGFIEPIVIGTLSLDYSHIAPVEIPMVDSSYSGSDKNPAKTRSRSTSINDINWLGLTKQFWFG